MSETVQKYYESFNAFLQLQSVSESSTQRRAWQHSIFSTKTVMKSMCACVPCTCCGGKIEAAPLFLRYAANTLHTVVLKKEIHKNEMHYRKEYVTLRSPAG